MESEASYNNTLADEGLFWDGLHEIFHMPCDSHAAIDNVLRAYLELTTKYKDTLSECEISQCSERLHDSELFAANADYIRRQILYCLLQEDAPDVLYVTASFLLYDGRQNEPTFEMMNKEGGFVRLLELIQSPEQFDGDGGAGLHRLLMNLMYEMCRIQRIRIGDLVLVDDDFVKHLFRIIEELSDDVGDPYHYPVIRVLLVLNEQFMVSAHDPLPERSSSMPLTNKVIKVLSTCGSVYKTFGENIILLLNRETETSLQLLTLKLLYLLFTTPPTYEYFYTNDLRVLVDILIRNLLDLPEEAAALRHTYLRVLYPLLAHTQLRYPPHYKREELRKLLGILVRGQFSNDPEEQERILHFDDVDETTKRLVLRCGQVDWLVDHEESKKRPQPGDGADAHTEENVNEAGTPTTSASTSSEPSSPPHKLTKRRSSQTISAVDSEQVKGIGMNLETARSSAASVNEVATHKEKPGVTVPSRKHGSKPPPAPPHVKQKPEPPKARRWRGRRGQQEEEPAGQKIAERETAVGGQSTVRERGPSLDRRGSGSVPRAAMPTDPTTHTTAQVTTQEHTVPAIVAPKSPLTPRPSTSSRAPALPPPRRSSHSVPPPSHIEQPASPHHHRTPPPLPLHHHPYHHHHSQPPSTRHLTPSSATFPSPTSNGHVQKPEPPMARRSRARRAQQAVAEKSKPVGDTAAGVASGSVNNDTKARNGGHDCGHEAAGSNHVQVSVSLEHVNGIEDGMGRMRMGEGG
ncbi:hypothetical protein AJ79_02649 [Helicocarpus griseus UAMH5409]|uniref:SPIN90/Ldb17 leucine-rich domain-containing protein n=1 Tax=Helicocarpus griseus UAMH5409 TaxID=1447875 RepID=A0A2B7Y250_9EURO|nr:hypothetical protein AJ79_02649 [Helicocarpus griseus UAMH5409]